MSEMIAWIAAQADEKAPNGSSIRGGQTGVPVEELPVHRVPGRSGALDVEDDRYACDLLEEVETMSAEESNTYAEQASEEQTDRWWTTEDSGEERQRRIYRNRTVAMLRRYMQYSIETGRMPSLLGREFFRSKVTSYTVVTFEDRVIFVHDMEKCLDRLDEFSRELIARHILQEHDREATARLLGCNEKTIRRLTPLILDQLSEILLDVGLIERSDRRR